MTDIRQKKDNENASNRFKAKLKKCILQLLKN